MHRVKIVEKKQVTHDTFSVKVEKPVGYAFRPGQAVYLALDIRHDGMHPFSIASTPRDNHIEFILKVYSPKGLPAQINNLSIGDSLLLGDAWGTIEYKGPGVFIAAGTGVVPFLSIARSIKEKNTLLLSNKTKNDVIYNNELSTCFDITHTFTRDGGVRISRENLQSMLSDNYYYICGPWEFTISMKKTLDQLGVPSDKIILEL